MNYICKFCDKICKNKNSKTQHELKCPKNEQRIYTNGMKGRRGSNQWIKSKENGTVYVLTDEARQNMSNGNKGRITSAETKKKLSISMKEYFKNNPDKVPYLLNHSSKI